MTRAGGSIIAQDSAQRAEDKRAMLEAAAQSTAAGNGGIGLYPSIANAKALGIYSGDPVNSYANSPEMREWKPDLEHDRTYVGIRSVLNLLTSGAGMVASGTVTGIGIGLIGAPDPTLVSKPVGYAIATYGATTFAKNLGDFSLNAANLWKVTTGSGNYYQDSIMEHIVESNGGSASQVRLAAAGNLTWDLLTGAGEARWMFSTGARYLPNTAALLQKPIASTTVLDKFVISSSGSVVANSTMSGYSVASKIANVQYLNAGNLGFDINENIANPFQKGYMPSIPQPWKN